MKKLHFTSGATLVPYRGGRSCGLQMSKGTFVASFSFSQPGLPIPKRLSLYYQWRMVQWATMRSRNLPHSIERTYKYTQINFSLV